MPALFAVTVFGLEPEREMVFPPPSVQEAEGVTLPEESEQLLAGLKQATRFLVEPKAIEKPLPLRRRPEEQEFSQSLREFERLTTTLSDRVPPGPVQVRV